MALNLIGVILFLTALSPASAAQRPCAKPWLFFDLGNTLVQTDFNPENHTIEKVRYFPKVHGYLESLRAKKYRIGLIVNIPEEWGIDRSAKVATLKKFVADHWTDSVAMDWSVFDLGILVPPTNAQRKPAPFLFQEAVNMAKEQGCRAIYQGESPREILAANQAGLLGHEVNRNPKVVKSFLADREILGFAEK